MKIQALAFIDKTEEPRLRLVNKTQLTIDLDKFDHDDKVWVTIETFFNKRTLAQNDVMHWYFQLIAEETGQTLEVVKIILKRKFLTVPVLDEHGEQAVDHDTGELLTKVLATSSLDTKQGAEFITNIITWALDFLGMILPLPEEVAKRKFK